MPWLSFACIIGRPMVNPIDAIGFPARCTYPGCNEVITDAEQADAHVTEVHLLEAVWLFATENIKQI